MRWEFFIKITKKLVIKRMHFYVSSLIVVHALHYPDADEIFIVAHALHMRKIYFLVLSKFSILFLAHAESEKIGFIVNAIFEVSLFEIKSMEKIHF